MSLRKPKLPERNILLESSVRTESRYWLDYTPSSLRTIASISFTNSARDRTPCVTGHQASDGPVRAAVFFGKLIHRTVSAAVAVVDFQCCRVRQQGRCRALTIQVMGTPSDRFIGYILRLSEFVVVGIDAIPDGACSDDQLIDGNIPNHQAPHRSCCRYGASFVHQLCSELGAYIEGGPVSLNQSDYWNDLISPAGP